MNSQTPLRSKMAQFIEFHIINMGLTQEEFARQAELTPATVSNLLRGKQQGVDRKALGPLSRCLNIPLEELAEAMITPVSPRMARAERLIDTLIEEPIISEKIEERIDALAQEINTYYGSRKFVVICLLTGNTMFFTDLLSRLTGLNRTTDFMKITREYTKDGEPYQEIGTPFDIEVNVEGQEVLLIDDSAYTGNVLRQVRDQLLGKGAKDIQICVLGDMRSVDCKAELTIAFQGFAKPGYYMGGYGRKLHNGQEAGAAAESEETESNSRVVTLRSIDQVEFPKHDPLYRKKTGNAGQTLASWPQRPAPSLEEANGGAERHIQECPV